MIGKKKCIPCQGGIPPLNKREINNFIQELNSDWKVYKGKEIRKEYVFKTYKQAIIFVNNVVRLKTNFSGDDSCPSWPSLS